MSLACLAFQLINSVSIQKVLNLTISSVSSISEKKIIKEIHRLIINPLDTSDCDDNIHIDKYTMKSGG